MSKRMSKRLANGTRIKVSSSHFSEKCTAIIRKGTFDCGWMYRIDVISGEVPEAARSTDGKIWVLDSEIKKSKS